MSTDISRRRFQPPDDFAAVLMQQGRVLLDADWNEWVEILDRRLRAETVDVIGRCVVPRETPAAFQIEISGTELRIGPGRIYVHGILAENHGAPPAEWDPVLAEERGTSAIPYAEQPYLPDLSLIQPEAPAEGGPHLVYLHVWRRDVTWLEAPGLLESAVGVDSTTRWQTVWQVRVLPNVGDGANCSTEIPAWNDLVQPSAGRLTTGTFQAPEDPNPCLVPPSGGYKGLENRLYRVEVHSVDDSGSAAFKWARHNASVAAAVQRIQGDTLTVDSTGRDAELRFSAGDWIEVTDDARELAGLPGIMRKIASVADATRSLVLEEALPGGVFPNGGGGATLPERHTRVRRWEQKGQVRDTGGAVHHDLNVPEADESRKGVIPVPGAGVALLLEDGIQIELGLDPSQPGGRFRAGDYWVFAARTADASIETLTEAPPRGIHHHYCRLAVVTFPDSVIDCRQFWPPEFGGEGCDCSVCVTAESHNGGTLTIQQAIDSVAGRGGTVCLGEGVYNLSGPFVRVEGAQSVRIRGQGWRTILAHGGPGPAMVMRGSIGVALERVAVLTARMAAGAADVAVENCADVAIEDCYFLQAGRPEQVKAAIGLGGVLVHARIRNNVIFATAGIANAVAIADADGVVDRPRALLTLNLCCEGNQLLCERFGIRLEGLCIHAGDTSLRRNFVNGARSGGLVATGAVLPSVFGGSRLDIAENTLRAAGDGIVAGTHDTRVCDNDIGPAPEGSPGHGIAAVEGILGAPLERLQVIGNRVQRVSGDGVRLATDIASAMIKQNQISETGGGGVVLVEGHSAGQLVVENNHLLGVLALGAEASARRFLAAIHVVSAEEVSILENEVRDSGSGAELPSRLAAIQAISCRRIRIAGNRVVNLGPAVARLPEVDAIAVLGSYESADLSGNSVYREPSVNDTGGRDFTRWRAIRIGSDREQRILELGAAMLVRARSVELLIGINRGVFRPLVLETVGISGNRCEGFGMSPALQVFGAESLQCMNNFVSWRLIEQAPVVTAEAAVLLLHGNHVGRGGPEDVLVQLTTDVKRMAVVGNVVHGQIRIGTAPLPSPWIQFNVMSV